MQLPGERDCCWTATADVTSFTNLGKTDVAIVGAGIVGLTAAYLLTRAGLSVTVLEARKGGRKSQGYSAR
jgi:monoamine oxidase